MYRAEARRAFSRAIMVPCSIHFTSSSREKLTFIFFPLFPLQRLTTFDLIYDKMDEPLLGQADVCYIHEYYVIHQKQRMEAVELICHWID